MTMPRLLFAAPFFLVASLAAQVPATAPTPPTPPVAPAFRLWPSPAMTPLMDQSWAEDMAAQARSWKDEALQYQVFANDMRLESLSSLNSLNSLHYALDVSPNFSTFNLGELGGGPVAWAHDDPADSLYRMARDRFSRGDYRRSADLFKSLPARYPNSAYIADAQYWQAFSLYRIGGTPELQQALAVLETRKPTEGPSHDRAANKVGGVGEASGANRVSVKTSSNINSVATVYSGSGFNYGPALSWGGSQTDAAGLAARIANVLSSRGLSADPAVKRALAAGGNSCDQDDQSVRAEALSALMQNDPATGRQMAAKILANKDDCSVPLRRNAVMLVGNSHDDAATATLIGVARTDPSQNVRVAALEYLTRSSSDAAINAVIDISHSSDDKQIQRYAVRALAQSTNPRARAEVRSIVENNSADEALRASVLDGMSGDRMSAEDATWLRSLYGRTTSPRIKERIISIVGRLGGDANNQWVATLLRNDDEPLELRAAALERVGRTMDVAALVKFYDASAERPIREEVIQLLAERKEPEALDKIVDIAKTGTDTRMRSEAINILSRSKDPRATKLLLQLVDH
jgi:HEAT repeat protein